MKKALALVLASVCLPLFAAGAHACGLHMGFNPNEMGFVSGTLARMGGLTPKAPVFKLKHPAMSLGAIGETNEIMVNYSAPAMARNVKLKLAGTRNIELVQDVIPLIDQSGSVAIAYTLAGSGYDSITVEITGEHDGETVRQVARIYVRASKLPSAEESKVSSR